MKKNFTVLSAKRILLALFFAFALGGIYSYSVQPASANQVLVPCGVTDQQCIDYLIGQGYRAVSVITVIDCDRYCNTANSWNTTVHVANGIITGHDDDPH